VIDVKIGYLSMKGSFMSLVIVQIMLDVISITLELYKIVKENANLSD